MKKQFKECMKHLNYDKIISVMEFLDWKWYSLTEPAVPNKKQIKSNCKYLFKSALAEYKRSGRGISATGGFEVEVQDDCVSVRFVLDYRDCSKEDLDG